MAGKKRKALPAKDAAEFRRWIGLRKRAKGLTTDQIVTTGEPERSRRWFYRAMDESQSLAIADAVELAIRMRDLGARMPESIVAKLNQPEPVMIIPKGESEQIAAALLGRFALKTKKAEDRIHTEMVRFFRAYERFCDTPTGFELIAKRRFTHSI